MLSCNCRSFSGEAWQVSSYDPQTVIQSYEQNAEFEDTSEKARSLRVEIPRAFIKRYLKPSDVVLDAGGGTGINAILMARLGARVTLLDLTPGMLQRAGQNIGEAGLADQIELRQGDVTNLSDYGDAQFGFVVCVGDAISYVLDQRQKALDELVRVAREGSILVIGCDSKYGFLRWKLARGDMAGALAIQKTNETLCGMGPRTYLYTAAEMTGLLEARGCRVLEVASTPTFADTIDTTEYESDAEKWRSLKELELALCTRPELLGVGLHLLFVARKSRAERQARSDRARRGTGHESE
jgi:ubiquinone/menaquinone biosynthesis C-methylase UbiE